MPRKPAPTPEHQWIYACTLPAEPRGVALAIRNMRVKVDVDTVFTVLDAYCDACHRTWDEAGDQPCEAAVSNAHLIGGPVGTRRKRVHDHDCALHGCKITPAEAAELRRAASNQAAPPRQHRVG